MPMKRLCVIMTVVMLLLFVSMPISVCAVENENKTIVTIDDLTVDETNASFSFIVNVETDEAYAGAEFGAFCSKGVEITYVESSCDSLAGPTQANGLVWFSFFDGENSFNGKQSVTVYGRYEVGQESAVIAKAYRISRVAFFLHKYAQARCQKTDIFFGELIRYDAAPSAGSEFDHTSLPFLQKHPWRCIRIAKGAVFVAPVFILLQECLRPEADCAAAWHRRGTPRLQYRSTVLLRYLPEHRQ